MQLFDLIYSWLVHGVSDPEEREKLDNQLFYDDTQDVPEGLEGVPVPSWWSAAGDNKIDSSRGFAQAPTMHPEQAKKQRDPNFKPKVVRN